MSNPNHTLTMEQSVKMKQAGKDPFAGVSTRYLIKKMRQLTGHAPGGSVRYDWEETPPYEEAYLALLSEELSNRPHVSNKKERKALRQKKGRKC